MLETNCLPAAMQERGFHWKEIMIFSLMGTTELPEGQGELQFPRPISLGGR